MLEILCCKYSVLVSDSICEAEMLEISKVFYFLSRYFECLFYRASNIAQFPSIKTFDQHYFPACISWLLHPFVIGFSYFSNLLKSSLNSFSTCSVFWLTVLCILHISYSISIILQLFNIILLVYECAPKMIKSKRVLFAVDSVFK